MDAILGARLRGGQVVGHLVPGGMLEAVLKRYRPLNFKLFILPYNVLKK